MIGLLLLISAPFLDSGVVYVLELQRDRKTFQIIQVIDRYTINNGFMVNNVFSDFATNIQPFTLRREWVNQVAAELVS